MAAAGDGVVAATALVLVGGRAAGSAVLVDERHLLTARHVVNQRSGGLGGDRATAEVRVVFPRLGGDGFEVTVLDVPGSAGMDFAVLDLAKRGVRAGVVPVPMWPGQRMPNAVGVFGYPLAEAAPNGVWRDFTVSGATSTRLRQLVWDAGAGSFPGHSGGPVVDATTHALVGILTEGSEKGRFDRFLPVTLVESVWPGLRRPWLYAGKETHSHVRRRGTGQRGRIQGGDLFKGRQAALQAIESWLPQTSSRGRPLVITGQPGAGKSSVLARTILNQEPVASYSGVVFHAQAATAAEFMDAVAAAVDAPDSGADALLDRLAERDDPPRRLAILVDALDEAVNAQQRALIATALSELSRLPWISVVVATRPLATGNRYLPGSLLYGLGVTSATSKSLVDLDVDPYWDRQALREFSAAVLVQQEARRPGPAGCAWESYRADPDLTGRLGRIIADRAGRNFLVAALTGTALSTAEEPVDPAGGDFDPAALPTTVGEAVDNYLNTITDAAEQVRIRGVLTALAHARGAGITDRLWLRFSAALGYKNVDQATLDVLRNSSAADYLLQTTSEDNQPVTRLFHQVLVEELLAARSSPDDYQAILKALRNDVRKAGGWSSAPPYHRTYTADHAVDAGRLARLLDDTAFVLNADPARLVSAGLMLSPAERTPTAVLVLQHGAQAGTLPPNARPFFLAMAATHMGLPQLRDACLAEHPSVVKPVWAHSLGSPHQRLLGHTSVSAVAIGRLGDQDVVVSGGDDTVRIWDATGHPIGDPLTGHTHWVSSVAVGRLGDRDVIVSGSHDGTVRIWDATGHPIGEPLAGHTAGVEAVAVGRLGDRDVIVSGSHDTTIRIWDATGYPVGESPLTGHTNWVEVVAVGRLDDRDVIVSGGNDGMLRIWDAAGRAIGEPLTGHTFSVNAVAVGRLDDRDVIVSGSRDTTIRIWDASGYPVGESLTGHTYGVEAVAVGRLDDRNVIVSGGNDGMVRIWDGAGQPIGEPLSGHTGWVTAVAVGRLGDRDVMVSGSHDGTVRIWDTTAHPIGHPLTGHITSLTAVAAGRLDDRDVIVSGGNDGTVRIWDGAGHPIGHPLTGHITSVTAVALGRLGDRDVIVSGGQDRTVRIWDGAGQPVGDPLIGHTTGWVNTVAVGRLGDRDVIASGGHDNTVRIWDSAGQPVGDPLIGHTNSVSAVAVGRLGDSDVIVSGSHDNTVRIWDGAGQPVGDPLTGHTNSVSAVAVGRLGDSDVIVSGSHDNTVQIWDATGPPIGNPLTGHTNAVGAVALGRLGDRNVIISGSGDGTVRIWDGAGHPIGDPLPLVEPCRALAVNFQRLILATGNAVALLESTEVP